MEGESFVISNVDGSGLQIVVVVHGADVEGVVSTCTLRAGGNRLIGIGI